MSMKTMSKAVKKATLLGLFFFSFAARSQDATGHYAVVKGDSIASIARKFNVSIGELIANNPGLNPTQLTVGQEIEVPKSTSLASGAILAPEMHSKTFESVLNYGVAQTLYSVFEVNCWSPLCGEEAFRLTENIHSKLGSSTKIDIVGQTNDDNLLTLNVFFPEFKIAGRMLSLKFLKNNDSYQFLGESFEEELSQYSDIQKNVDIVLPQDYAAIVKNEFRLKAGDNDRLQQWCQQIIKEAVPNAAGQTNHFFAAPFSPRYDAFQATFYWLEGKKVFRAELNIDPYNHRHMEWKDLGDYGAIPASPKIGDQAGFLEWRNWTIARHVADGDLIVVPPI